MTVPRRFVGVWRRVGFGVEDEPVRLDGEVWWLQVDECFADLRSGGSERRAFAGRASWSEPSMTWSAEVEFPASTGRSLPDVGSLTGDADLLVERGTWLRDGRAERYVEHWQRIEPPGPVLALRRGVQRFLAVGDTAVLVTPAGGRRWQRNGAAWVDDATVGEVSEAQPPAAGDGWIPWS